MKVVGLAIAALGGTLLTGWASALAVKKTLENKKLQTELKGLYDREMDKGRTQKGISTEHSNALMDKIDSFTNKIHKLNETVASLDYRLEGIPITIRRLLNTDTAGPTTATVNDR